ncbi:hypothetical protein [Pseudomonas sp. DC3000-4b1]|uniref:hypothetical protein n=1 Tax=unclassified Pseudomonas TaxID=196821 RepID=UPI003CEC7E70
MTTGEYISVGGLLLTALATFGGWAWQRYQERLSVRTALIAEVRTLCEIAKERGYLADLEDTAQHIAALPENLRSSISVAVPIASHYCRVYTANLTKLGYLKPRDALSVVRFYQLVDSVVQDVSKGGSLHEGTDDPSSCQHPQEGFR